MFDRSRNCPVYLKERNPDPHDYRGYNRIEVVHLPLGRESESERVTLIRERLNQLIRNGVQVRHVDVETPPIEGDRKVILGGGLGDVCVEWRRTFLKELGLRVTIDDALTIY